MASDASTLTPGPPYARFSRRLKAVLLDWMLAMGPAVRRLDGGKQRAERHFVS
jgi:hypothetical protein